MNICYKEPVMQQVTEVFMQELNRHLIPLTFITKNYPDCGMHEHCEIYPIALYITNYMYVYSVI